MLSYRGAVRNCGQQSNNLLKTKLEHALKLADELDLTLVGAWISSAIDALSTVDATALPPGGSVGR
jgi:hypothetical protein